MARGNSLILVNETNVLKRIPRNFEFKEDCQMKRDDDSNYGQMVEQDNNMKQQDNLYENRPIYLEFILIIILCAGRRKIELTSK